MPLPPLSYELRIYAPGASTPLKVVSVAAKDVASNLARPTDSSGFVTVNPRAAVWDDPVNAGKVCQMNMAVVADLPPAAYEATVVEVSASGRSPESAPRSPFTLEPPPAALTGLRFTL